MTIRPTIAGSDTLKAIETIDTGAYPIPNIRRSHDYCLKYSGKNFSHFPPEEVARQAYALRNGTELWDFEVARKATASAGRAVSRQVRIVVVLHIRGHYPTQSI